MSVVKLKFTGILRSLLRRFDDGEPGASKTSRRVVAGSSATVSPAAEMPATGALAAAERRPASPAPVAVPPPPAAPGKPVEIQLPVTPILTALPIELRAKIVGENTVGMMISLPVDKVLAQLATGSVKITFGELRQLAPGVFASFGGESDAKEVALPLHLILSQLNPALLARRASAKKLVELSDDIASPFSANGHGLANSTGHSDPVAAPQPPPAPIPLSRLVPVSDSAHLPPVAPPNGFTPRWALPPTNGHAQEHANGARQAMNLSAAPVPPATASPIPPMAASPEQSQPTFSAPLGALAESWPEELRLEIEQLDLLDAQVALPVHLVEPALKRGRVIFSWRYLRTWIESAAVATSVHDGLELELPLKVITPLFFSRKNEPAKAQKKAAVTEEIPNLFFGLPQPETAPETATPPPVSASAPLPDTNYFTRSNAGQTSDSEFKRKGGTDFLTRAATPSEVVFRAMELPPVAGAIIALPDGLMVASQIPADLNGETLAAFIPQIFARVKQCSQELRMGEMNNLSFTVGNVPWKIFRVNAVYFAAFGRANESLPNAPLVALAGSLDRKKT